MKLFSLLFSFFLFFGTNFAQDFQVSALNGYSADYPHVALGTDNANLIFGTNFYFYSFSVDGPSAPISDPVRPSADAYGPNTTDIAVNPNNPNEVAIAYLDFHYQYDPVVQFYGVYLVKSNDGGVNWDSPVLMDTVVYGNSISNLSNSLPDVEYSYNGNLFVLYRVDHNSLVTNAVYVWKDGVKTRIDDPTTDDFETAIAFTVEDNSVTVSYAKSVDGNVLFYLKNSTDGGVDYSNEILVKNVGSAFITEENVTKAFYNGDGSLEYVLSYFGSNVKWYHSEDGGANWTFAATVDSHPYLGFVAIKRLSEHYYMKIYSYNQNVYMTYGDYLSTLNYEGLKLNSVPDHVVGGDYIDFSMNSQTEKYAVSWQDDRTGNTEIFYKSSVLPPLVGVEENSEAPTKFELSQNYPNPFNPSTTISYSLPQNGFVQLSIYNILGRKVATLVSGNKLAGNYSVQFDASNLNSGIYFYTLRTNNFTATKKMILLK